jgi:hypothetical protein
MRPVEAERRKTEIEVGLAGENWHDPVEGRSVCMSGLSHEWVEHWLPTRHDLRATNWGRLETTVQKQSGPASAPRRFLRSRTSASDNGSPISASGLSAATTRKCLAAAIADNRRQFNPATAVPLPTERQKPTRYYRRPKLNDWLRRCRDSTVRWY